MAMIYDGDVKGTIAKVVESFENGNIPAKLAQAFIQGAAEKHIASYSFMNRLIVILHGYSDAMGYGQWKKVGRHVKKGETAFSILAPKIAKKKVQMVNEFGKVVEIEQSYCYGFKAVKVFGLEQTEGKEIETSSEVVNFLNNLPLLDVAKKWGINVQAYNGTEHGSLGYYTLDGQNIALGVQNLSTWAHELCHAADDRLGSLKDDKRWVAEVAAELSGAVLLEALGYTNESDKGGAWEYIKSYANRNGVEAIEACRQVVGRVEKIVSLILETAKEGVAA
jgi:antirestriction protein ArdC